MNFRCECGEFKFHTDSHCIDCLKKDPVMKLIMGEEE